MKRTSRSGERGVSALLFAMLLTVLLTASAFAIDIGAAYTERRLDQNAVDAAAVSGLIVGVVGDDSDADGRLIDQIVEETVAKVDATLGRTVTAAQWAACTDADRLPRTAKVLGLTPATECISFSVGFSRIRVKVPQQQAMGVFGPALGFGNIQVTAEAEAELVVSPGSGAPPFIALENATKGDFVCLRTGGNQNAEPITLMQGNGPGPDAIRGPTPSAIKDPCDSTQYPVASSTFGTVSPHAYANNCYQRDEETKIAIAVGMDHVLGIFPDGYVPGVTPVSEIRRDGDLNCTVEFPNTLEVDTGFSAQNLRCALLSLSFNDLCENEFPRLRQGDNVQTTYRVVTEPFDNIPPWNYFRPAADLYDEGAPPACVILAASRVSDTSFDSQLKDAYLWFKMKYPTTEDQHWDAYDRFDFFTGQLPVHQDASTTVPSCMDDWGAGDPELFEAEIGESPRFAFIPQVAEASLANNSEVHIEGFLPIFLFRMYISDNGSTMCDTRDGRATTYKIHDAGHRYSCGSNNQNIDRLASLVMACGMLPPSLCSKETGLPASFGKDIYNIELVR